MRSMRLTLFMNYTKEEFLRFKLKPPKMTRENLFKQLQKDLNNGDPNFTAAYDTLYLLKRLAIINKSQKRIDSAFMAAFQMFGVTRENIQARDGTLSATKSNNKSNSFGSIAS